MFAKFIKLIGVLLLIPVEFILVGKIEPLLYCSSDTCDNSTNSIIIYLLIIILAFVALDIYLVYCIFKKKIIIIVSTILTVILLGIFLFIINQEQKVPCTKEGGIIYRHMMDGNNNLEQCCPGLVEKSHNTSSVIYSDVVCSKE